MIRRSVGGLGIDPAEPKFRQIEFVDKDIDYARTVLSLLRIAAAETAIRSLAGLIGNRNQSSSSIHSVPGIIG